MDSRAARLARLGQSIWYDNVSRDLLDSGELARLVAEHGVRGVTSNPTIFQKAMSSAKAYQAQFEALAGRGATADAIYEACAVEDIRRGADILRGVHDASGGTDGFISLEVSPRLAADTAATIAEAKRLHAAVGRPNLMIKVPATPEGIPAVRALIAAGISVNVTLIFSVGAYADVVEAYLSGLEERVAAGLSVAHIASVASFFVSRVDTAIDAALDAKAKAEPARAAEIRALRGRAAIANAQLAYELFEQRFAGDRWDRLAARGAQLQRPLWASTSTKNPEYRDTIYVDALIGAHTVNTVPPATLTALNDHGHVGLTIHDGMQGARGLLAQLEAEGISIGAVCADLLRAGVASFAQSFDDLLGAVEKRRAAAPASAGGAVGHDRVAQLRLGALEGLFARDALRRIWARDGALFGTNAEARASASNRLGWLAAHEAMRLRLPEIREFADGVRADGLTDVILCGMGGSSLCAEVLRDVLGAQPGGLRLQVLDSTDPEAIRLAESSCDLAKTLIVVASKSGSTVETDCLMRHFLERHRAAGRAGAGRFFTAITDPGSSLVATAEKLHFRAIFENPQDIGGRYSALSLFGLVPAALLGADLDAILASAAAAAHRNGPDADPVNASGLQLGAVIGALALAGADKLTLRTSPRLSSFGAWAEQLIAESTGKQGKGVLPVVDEPAGCPQGSDRTCVDLALVGDAGPPAGPRPEAVVVAGSASDLGALFWQFEMATAVSGVVLGVNPFDEPNVAEAKAATNAVLAGTGEAVPLAVGRAPHFDLHMPRALGGKCPQELFAEAAAGDYVAILAYVARTPHRHELLQSMRAAVAKSSKLATTLGYGPRYLHSTGQLHKGGAGNGIFLLVTVDPDPSSDLPVPGRAHSFGTLFAAQAEGDFRTLVAHGRRVVELRLRRPVDASLAALVAAFA